jgi:molybdopterin synthase sulfur carrier subunit
MAPVHLHSWAGAKAAAGTAGETVEAESVRRALEIVCAAHPDPGFRRVIRACSLLIDGVAAHEPDLDRVLAGPVRVELLPPFAGGAAAAETRSPTVWMPGLVPQIT